MVHALGYGGNAFFVCFGAHPSFEMQRSSSTTLISLYLLLGVFLLPFVLSLLLFVIASVQAGMSQSMADDGEDTTCNRLAPEWLPSSIRNDLHKTQKQMGC